MKNCSNEIHISRRSSALYSPCWPVFVPQIIGDDFPPPPAVTENESVAQSPADEPMAFGVFAGVATGGAITNV